MVLWSKLSFADIGANVVCQELVSFLLGVAGLYCCLQVVFDAVTVDRGWFVLSRPFRSMSGKKAYVMSSLYFAAGVYLGLGGAVSVRRVINWFSKHFGLLLFAVFLIVGLRVWTACRGIVWTETIGWVLVPVTILMVWIGYDRVSSKTRGCVVSPSLQVACRQSFFVFCFHGIVMSRWLNGDWLRAVGCNPISALVLALGVVVVGVVLGWVIERICPKLRVVLCGGR